jgi:DNA-3-methyladenine glycosylase
LIREGPDGRLVARIVETEAYEQDDPASHSFRGRTGRNSVMFDAPGSLYVYFTYGMHHCMNVVAGEVGEGSAVLIRSAEPLEGLDLMSARRRTDRSELLCSGPARLCQAFGVTRSEDGLDLPTSDEMWVAAGQGGPAASGPRIGIRDGIDRDWRFWLDGDPWVSRPGRAPR